MGCEGMLRHAMHVTFTPLAYYSSTFISIAKD